MWTKVPPECLMGRIINDPNSYHRIDLTESDEDYQKRASYDCGVYFVFSCNTPFLYIKTKVHYKPSTDNRKVATGIQILGKVDGVWELINNTPRINNVLCDRETIIYYTLPQHKYTEFQICFPAQGRIEEYFMIKTAEEPIFKTLPLEAVVLGSSVAQDNNSSSHMNLCCYAYRKLGINMATLGISHHNVLKCQEALERALMLDQNVKFILMDVNNVLEEELTNFKEMFRDRKLYSLVIANKCKESVTNLLAAHPEIDTIDIDADGRYDQTHLNDYGTVLYMNELLRKGIL